VDGGFIFCGSALDSIQKAWIVKTDCFGCDGELCHYPDSACYFYDCTQYPIDAGFTTEITGSGVNFENNSFNATSRYWDFGDGNKAYTDSVVSHSYEQGGTYTVTLIVYHAACSDTVRESITVTGAEEFEKSKLRFTIVPNPASQYVNVVMSELANEGMVVIYDFYGKKVKGVSIAGRSNIGIDLSDVAAGIYYCTLVKENIIVGREKLVVVR
jgi:PKD repeat protein